MISIDAFKDWTLHGFIYGLIGYASYRSNSYIAFRENFQMRIKTHGLLHAELHRLVEDTVEVCEEGSFILNKTKEKVLQIEGDNYYDLIMVWGSCLKLKNMFDLIIKKSDKVDQSIKKCHNVIGSSVQEYEHIKSWNKLVYQISTLLLTRFFLGAPTVLFHSFTSIDAIAVAGISATVGFGFVNLMNKCLSLEEKSMSIVYKRIVSNIYKLNRKNSNFTFPLKTNIAVDIQDYEFLILKTIKYCDIQGNEKRISKLKIQMIKKVDSLQDRLNNIILDTAPRKLSKIRIMQYEKNPVDLLSTTSSTSL